MQDLPLNIPMILRHAERMHPRKTVATNTGDGLRVTTYATLLERTRRLASALQGLGVAPDDRVATFCWNHQQHLEAYLAVPSIGSILHTLNIRLFAADLAYIVEHAADSVVLVDKSLWPAWEKVAARVSCVRRVIVVDDASGPLPHGALDYETLLQGAEPVAELPDVAESQAAAMCYTSGTTGHPKGVVYSHRSNVLHSYALAMADGFGLREADVVLSIVPMFHANAWGLPYGCLMVGADLVLPGRFLDPASLTRLLVERKVTFTAGVPTVWQTLLEPLREVRNELALRLAICGGAVLPPSLQRTYREEIGVDMIHSWGMTETSPVGSLARPLAAHAAQAPDRMASVLTAQGRVLPGLEARIVDADGRVLPWDGKAFGELQVRGHWVASGYYLDTESAAKFADGWLRTGDVATIDREGYIRIVDRTKDVIKSGGEWISSVKLESLIMAHPDVAEAAVIGLPHPRWDERPLACVVTRPEARGKLDAKAIIEHLRPHVAKWWLPDDVVWIDEVPRTSVGKFNKKALRERFKDHFAGPHADVTG